MKKLLSILICCCLLLALVPAMAAGISEVMCVTNCKEWVSLRELPDTKAKRLAQVRLGELVTGCTAAENDFIQCEFGNKTGYIQSQYLKETVFSPEDTFPGNQMVVNVSEWASLWAEPSSSSARVAKVPVGTIVTSCVNSVDNFIYCEYKSGRNTYQGFMSRSYLKKANYNASKQDSKVTPEAGTDVVGISMTVVNCEEWVSLREKASTAAARLARVPLGAQVDNCVQVSDGFIYCSYRGVYGYIQSQYLKDPNKRESASSDPLLPEPVIIVPSTDNSESFESLPVLPDRETFLKTGFTVLNETYQGYTITVQRIWNTFEEMLAVCYDQNSQPLWRLYAQSLNEISDTAQLDAFIGGTAEDPQLIWYISGLGFYSYSYGPELQLRWFLPNDAGLEINDSIKHAADVDGTFYVAFSDVLMHISADGQLLWRTSVADSSIFWPHTIEITEDGINVPYANLMGVNDTCTGARGTPEGTVQNVTQRQIPAEA